MAHHLPYHDPIFLFHKALVSLLIWPSSRKGDLLTHTIRGYLFIDKFSTVIGINPENGKGKQRPATPESRQNRLSSTVE